MPEGNYRKALQLLKDIFESKAVIAQAHIGGAFQPSLRGLVDAVNSELVSLQLLGTDTEVLD